ncbi:ArsC family transcriptional regulator [Heliobacterium undosum]|uniref:ArsC family transcriptional regulator n=1 Tax=Heliomicrobium undosum TaxID=121734 RepID=A0A845L0A4_9FIRM|nr:arsenate reductase family protein [Heliomicrobium undosum]MZP28319.1 ArsC family transcriptional regulator [Heliomicrobium undosum]
MNIQIWGTKKCQDTRKAERYFKERRIKFQFIDLAVKGLSKGEFASVKAAVGLDNLIDKAGKEYAKRNLKYLVHDVEEVLMENPLLFKTPIVRNGRQATVGYCPDAWATWE